MAFFRQSILIVTLLWADNWSEFSAAEEETSNLAAKVTLGGKTVLAGLIPERPGNGQKTVGALLD